MGCSHEVSRSTFSLAELAPRGWYLQQLRIQQAGLSGHLDEFWPDIRDSKWIGGDRDGWERLPYWLDGFIPLARLLNDPAMLARARRCVDAILARQQPDGWICPTDEQERGRYDLWAAFLVAKVLVVWYDATGDGRIEEAVARLLACIHIHIRHHTLFNWAQTRWFECLIPLLWLYERRPEEWLVHLARELQAQGFDWGAYFRGWPAREPNPQGQWSQMHHVVNNAMMLKYPALLRRLFPEEEGVGDAADMLRQLDQWHGSANGTFTGDECLAGQSPVAGTELCAVAEMMYSLQWVQTQSDDTAWGDRLEKLAFNAWPATFDPTMWAHQYVQQVNQVQAVPVEHPVYRTNGPEANTFGLEPEFGCCTANLSQGWPKLIQSVYYRRGKGIDIAMFLPSRLETRMDGCPVAVQMDTDYPFRDTVTVRVENPRGLAFPLRVRIPGWAEGASITCGGEKRAVRAGQYETIMSVAGVTELTLTLPQQPRLEARPQGMVCLHRGPLLYSLAIEEAWEPCHQDVPGREYPHCDYLVTPRSPWNYAFVRDARPSFAERPMGDMPFSPEQSPVEAQVACRRIPWPMEHGAAAPRPDPTPEGGVEMVRFIPYGCTCLRMTELPQVPGDA